MPILSTLSAAFAHFGGARAANPRWGWAAQSDDGTVVVVTMWRDLMGKDGDTVVYGNRRGADLAVWTNRLGNHDHHKGAPTCAAAL